MPLSIGERYLQKLLPNKRIESAGTSALIDHEADNSAIKVAAEHGISLAGHKGRQYTSSLGRQYDLILVMEKYHLEKSGKYRLRQEVKQCYLVIG